MDILIKLNIKYSYSNSHQCRSKQLDFKLSDFNKLYS